MTVFLKGRKLWHYVNGSIPKPLPIPRSKAAIDAGASKTTVAEDDYEALLKEWESILRTLGFLSNIRTVVDLCILWWVYMRILSLLGLLYLTGLLLLLLILQSRSSSPRRTVSLFITCHPLTMCWLHPLLPTTSHCCIHYSSPINRWASYLSIFQRYLLRVLSCQGPWYLYLSQTTEIHAKVDQSSSSSGSYYVSLRSIGSYKSIFGFLTYYN